MEGEDLEWWTRAIAEAYLPLVGPQQAAMLSVDRPSLGELVGGDGDAAVASLAAAVRAQMRRPPSIAPVLRDTRYWRRTTDRSTPPPCLPLLALVVLAASEMGVHRGLAAHNYYGVLREILGIGGAGAPVSFMESIEDLWAELDRWIDEDLDGARGTSTFKPPGDHFRYIGYGIAQARVRAVERRLIRRFVHDLGDEVVGTPIADVLRLLEIWLLRHGTSAARLLGLLHDTSFRPLCEFIVSAEIERGAQRDHHGRGRGRVEIAIEQAPFALQLVARRGDGWPDRLSLWAHGQGDIALRAFTDRWYDPAPLTGLDPRQALREGLVLASADLELELDPVEVWALRHDDDLGAWVSVSRMRFEDDHLLLVTTDLAEDVQAYAAAHGTVTGEPRAAGTLEGWRLIGPVQFAAPPSEPPPPDLARLLGTVAVGLRLQLLGGLRVSAFARTFLTGGEPVLLLPQALAGLPVVLNGPTGSRRLDPDGTLVRLSGLALGEGHYRIEVGEHHVELQLVDHLRTDLPDGMGEYSTDGTDATFTGYLPAPPQSPRPDPSTVAHTPDHTYALGARPYDVVKLRPPVWLEALSGGPLSWSRVEVHAPFEVVWVVTVNAGRTHATALAMREPLEGHDHARLWAQLIATAETDDDPSARELLARYRHIAAPIMRQHS